MLGLEEGRLRLEWISAAEGARFAQIIDEFIEQLRVLGPSPLFADKAPPAPEPESEEAIASV